MRTADISQTTFWAIIYVRQKARFCPSISEQCSIWAGDVLILRSFPGLVVFHWQGISRSYGDWRYRTGKVSLIFTGFPGQGVQANIRRKIQRVENERRNREGAFILLAIDFFSSFVCFQSSREIRTLPNFNRKVLLEKATRTHYILHAKEIDYLTIR